jgi:hypothetical protein
LKRRGWGAVTEDEVRASEDARKAPEQQQLEGRNSVPLACRKGRVRCTHARGDLGKPQNRSPRVSRAADGCADEERAGSGDGKGKRVFVVRRLHERRLGCVALSLMTV